VDVLFAPFTTELGGGYYRIDPQVRWHCLGLLRSLYREETRSRQYRVAELLWRYVESLEYKATRVSNPLLTEYLAVQRWVSLAFLDPSQAARAFATALHDAGDKPGTAAFLRFGGVTSALEIPLANEQELLVYARGMNALAIGDEIVACEILESLDSNELRIGDIVLRIPTKVLREAMTLDRNPPGNGARSTIKHVELFLSAVGKEFRSYRDSLRHDLDRPNVTVKVQEDFIANGTETLDKLDEYIRQCDAVIHLAGDMTGAWANATAVEALRQRYPNFAERLPVLDPFLKPGAPALSYTQWEAWLALYHRKILIIATPEDGAPRDERYELNEDERAAQQEHLERLAKVGRYPEIHFANADQLAVNMLRSKLHDILALTGGMTQPGANVVTKPINLPYLSIGHLFKGRDAALDDLSQSFGAVSDSVTMPVVTQVLNGLGGVGKTRLALEYAWKRADEYQALLFVTADSPGAFQRNLAALCGPSILSLPEQDETDQVKQRNAVITWLQQHPGWLLILDNIDSEEAATAAEALLAQLAGGHILLTSRLGNWTSSIFPLTLDVLSTEAAVDFLLARTAETRRRQPDDAAMARTLAEELGHLALALEQVGAYIAKAHLSLADYLKEWQGQREKVLDWFDPRLMQYPSSIAITWQTSFELLGESARVLLQRLAWLGSEPIPESLLEVVMPDAPEIDPFAALAELESYALVMRAADANVFSIHPFLQEVVRRSQRDDLAHAIVGEALHWLNFAFVGNPQDVRTWPVLIPLAPHVQTAIAYADDIGIEDPAARLLNDLGLLYQAQGQYAQAEPLFQRALAFRERVLGADHPDVATSLNHLAELYRTQGQYAKAEPLFQRALAIREMVFNPDHPDVATSLNNLAELYRTQGQYAKAEPLFQRALAIREKVFNPDHPDVATSLKNLANLYEAQGRYAEAEPLHQRALGIEESMAALQKKIAKEEKETAWWQANERAREQEVADSKSVLFLSYSSADELEAVALKHWLFDNGWDDVFLDLDPERGLKAGDRWQEALKRAVDRCKAVMFIISPAWAKSRWCLAEFLLAKSLSKHIFGVIVKETALSELPTELTSEFHLTYLVGKGEAEVIHFNHHEQPAEISFLAQGLGWLRARLQAVGLSANLDRTKKLP
jgi:tetratricopeptide (TPR) repeat protein